MCRPPGRSSTVCPAGTGISATSRIRITSPIARKVEMHSHIRDGEVMRMREVADIPVPAGQTVELRPGGLHIMLIGLTEPLRQGTEVPLTLQFEQAGRLEVMLHVQAAGASGPGHHH
jgi:copper(I)-binding protein